MRRILPFCGFDQLILSNRYTATPEEMLCLVLMRLAYPTRLHSLCSVFGRSQSWLSTVWTDVLLHLYDRWKRALEWDSNWLTIDRLRGFARAIEEQGGDGLYWGYIDGTRRRIAKPVRHQKQAFSGHKWMHCFAMQSVITPDGLIASLYGPYVGKSHDSDILRQSGVTAKLRDVFPLLLFYAIY